GGARPCRGGLDRHVFQRARHLRAARAGRHHDQPEDGHSRVELRQRCGQRHSLPGAAQGQDRRAEGREGGSRTRLRPPDGLQGGAALPQLRRADGVHGEGLHRVRRLRRHLPDGLHHLHREWRGGRPPDPSYGPRLEPHAGPLYRRWPAHRPSDGEGRGRLSPLRALRRALPDRRVGHAEIPDRHHAGGARMPADTVTQAIAKPAPLTAVNDFVVKFANVNGSGSASANGLFAKSIIRMGVPVSARNIFPSNIQGLPTWYEVRVTEASHLGRRGGVDLAVALNPQTWDDDIKEILPGGYLFYDCTKPLPPSKFRDDVHVIGVPLTAICNEAYRSEEH